MSEKEAPKPEEQETPIRKLKPEPTPDQPPSFKLSAGETATLMRAEADLERMKALYHGPLAEIDQAAAKMQSLLAKVLEFHGAPPGHAWTFRQEGDDVFLDGVEANGE